MPDSCRKREVSGRPRRAGRAARRRGAASSRSRSSCRIASTKARRSTSAAPGSRGLAARERAQAADERRALRAGIADEHSGPHRRRPEPVRAAEQRGERLAQPLRAERLVLEQRRAPSARAPRRARGRPRSRRAARAGRPASFPRHGSSRVGSPAGSVAAMPSSGRAPNGCRSSRSRTTGPAADRRAGREPERGDGVGELGRRVGRDSSPPGARARARGRSVRSGSWPKPAAAAHAPPASVRRSRRRSSRAPGSRGRARSGCRPRGRRAARPRAYERFGAEQRALELAVDPLEGAVLPVEPAAGLAGAGRAAASRIARKSARSLGRVGVRRRRRSPRAGSRAQLVERDPRVLELRERVRARLGRGRAISGRYS